MKGSRHNKSWGKRLVGFNGMARVHTFAIGLFGRWFVGKQNLG